MMISLNSTFKLYKIYICIFKQNSKEQYSIYFFIDNLKLLFDLFLQRQAVMFLQEFEQSIRGQSHKMKKTRKEYSAGFKNYHPNKRTHKDQTAQNTEAQSDLFDQLKIGNLKELYLHQQPVVNNEKQIYQAQQKSVQRLTKKPERKKEQNQESSQENQIAHSQNLLKFSQIYHKVSNFQSTANTTLFKSQFKKIEGKLNEKYSQNSKAKDFISSLVNFLGAKHKSIQSNNISNDQLLLQYSNFLNETTHKQQKPKIELIKRQQLQPFLRKSMYLYTKFDINKSKPVMSIQNLHDLIRNQQQIENMSIDEHLISLLHKKYTVPYESQLYKQSNKSSSIIDQIGNNNLTNTVEPKYVFSANPVPNTTYQKPKERPKSVKKSQTMVQPFNLTNNNRKDQKTLENYYKWDRNFHARQIPKTLYEAYEINSLDEAQKKRRMTELLKSASYPSTMVYLQDYNKYTKQKQQHLKEKYVKKHNLMSTGEKIPDFDHMHQHQIALLENRKAENRHLTTPQPFNLSQPKPRRQRQHIPISLQSQNHQQQKIIKQSSKFQPQSTLKFQAYVNLRKKQKQQKQSEKMMLKKKQQKNQSQKKIYKDILKERIDHELHNNPKVHVNPQPLNDNIVKVNLQKIYYVEPLLIQRESKKGKQVQKQYKKDWDPII